MIKGIRWVLLGASIFSFALAAEEKGVDCEQAVSTLEVNECLGQEFDLAWAELARYLDVIYARHKEDPLLVDEIRAAQQDWETYADSHCGSIYTYWREGSIRNTLAISCGIRLTRQRTHELWQSFLTHMDSTPPVLPEPAR